jgi:linoleate 10R-lipoxygenase
LADVSNSCQPSEFPDPTAVNAHRPVSSYNLNGVGFHLCPGATYAVQTIAEIVKVVFKLKNIRRAPGDAGKLARFTEIVRETETDLFVQRDGSVSPWPGSMYIVVCLIYLWFYAKEPCY